MLFHYLLEHAVLICLFTRIIHLGVWCFENADVLQSEDGVFWLVFRFLYKQLLLFFDADPEAKESCIFESRAESYQLQLKPKISLHLYTNQCPEGAAKNFYFKYSSLIFLSFYCFSMRGSITTFNPPGGFKKQLENNSVM